MIIDGATVWRGLDARALEDFEALRATKLFAQAQADGRLVATDLVADPPEEVAHGWSAVLRHERVEPISYPYEWSYSMLRDAALLQLDLSRAALAEGILTKDATPYNVQFRGSRPVFIDIGSFEVLDRGAPWAGYRQFCELFLNPLVLQADVGVPFHPWLRGAVDGISPVHTAALLGRRRPLRRDLLTHIRLHARAEARFADADTERDVGAELRQAGFGPKVIDAQLGNLRRTVERLEWRASASTWSGYGSRGHYSDDDIAAKELFVGAATRRTGARSVLDLGANDGRFSKVALDAGANRAVAVDGDHLVVDHLYRQLRADDEDRILPLVIDLTNPSPSLGWRSRERPSFVERIRPDLVLCLAVVHHLALSGTVPFDEIVQFLRDFDAPVVVELPHPEDPMARRLLARKRDGLFDHYGRPQWEAALGRRFSIEQREALPSGYRTLYLCNPA